jgi:CelD/BcsL family acetyltransferase involved in cellulose biosynthesis
VQRFHHEAIPSLAAAGLARVHGLTIGGRPAAVALALRDTRAVQYYIGGFDPAFASVSPGTLLIAHVVDRANAEGAAEVDFLRGGEAYKYRFGARDHHNHARRLVYSGLARIH